MARCHSGFNRDRVVTRTHALAVQCDSLVFQDVRQDCCTLLSPWIKARHFWRHPTRQDKLEWAPRRDLLRGHISIQEEAVEECFITPYTLLQTVHKEEMLQMGSGSGCHDWLVDQACHLHHMCHWVVGSCHKCVTARVKGSLLLSLVAFIWFYLLRAV